MLLPFVSMMGTTKLGRLASGIRVASSVIEVGVVAPLLLITVVELLLIGGCGPPI